MVACDQFWKKQRNPERTDEFSMKSTDYRQYILGDLTDKCDQLIKLLNGLIVRKKKFSMYGLLLYLLIIISSHEIRF